LIRNQGALFNSTLHFIGFGNGAVVNTEIVQRLGTYFPGAGGVLQADKEPGKNVRDLQVTTIDPFQYGIGGTGSKGNIIDPNIVTWENVTYADNYYQTSSSTQDGMKIESADFNVQLDGIAQLTDPLDGVDGADAAAHARSFLWYAGTANLSPSAFGEFAKQTIFRRLGDLVQAKGDSALTKGELDLTKIDSSSTWYSPDHRFSSYKRGESNAPWEGIGTGWFTSVLGGGSLLRETDDQEKADRSLVSKDNNNEAALAQRGDYAVPTLFNGNFDAVTSARDSQAIPGWSFYGRGENVTQSNLVKWNQFLPPKELEKLGYDANRPNYALRLGGVDGATAVTHNPFIVPDWGVLRFDLHTPFAATADRVPTTSLRAYIRSSDLGGSWESLQPVFTYQAIDPNPATRPNAVGYYDYVNGLYVDPYTYQIGYGVTGFETFHLAIPDKFRGKVAEIEFKYLGDESIYLDNVFFKSEALKFGNPQPVDTKSSDNYLIERPQYTLSYNDEQRGSNWVAWKLDKSWLGAAELPDNSVIRDLGYPPAGLSEGNYPFEITDYPWLPDNSLPAEFTTSVASDIVKNDFQLQRGHLAPIADRKRSLKDLYSTYLTSNTLPQQKDLNNGVWKAVEGRSRSYVGGSGDELYIIVGGAGYEDERVDRGYPEPLLRNYIYKRSDGRFAFGIEDNSRRIIGDQKIDEIRRENPGLLENAPVGKILITNSKNIRVPQYFWKIILPLAPGKRLDDIDENTPVIALIIANREPLADSTGPHTIPLPNSDRLPDGEKELSITEWSQPGYLTRRERRGPKTGENEITTRHSAVQKDAPTPNRV
jgi:DNA/RNA endonuclease G (NUC1)